MKNSVLPLLKSGAKYLSIYKVRKGSAFAGKRRNKKKERKRKEERKKRENKKQNKVVRKQESAKVCQ